MLVGKFKLYALRETNLEVAQAFFDPKVRETPFQHKKRKQEPFISLRAPLKDALMAKNTAHILRDTKTRIIYIPKRDDEDPRPLHMGVLPRGGACPSDPNGKNL